MGGCHWGARRKEMSVKSDWTIDDGPREEITSHYNFGSGSRTDARKCGLPSQVNINHSHVRLKPGNFA